MAVNLVEDIWVLVFKKMSPIDLARLAQVSKLFRILADADLQWNRFLLEPYISSAGVDPVLVQGSRLSRSLTDVGLERDRFFWFLLKSQTTLETASANAKCAFLKDHLSISHYYRIYHPEATEAIKKLINHNSDLNSLHNSNHNSDLDSPLRCLQISGLKLSRSRLFFLYTILKQNKLFTVYFVRLIYLRSYNNTVRVEALLTLKMCDLLNAEKAQIILGESEVPAVGLNNFWGGHQVDAFFYNSKNTEAIWPYLSLFADPKIKLLFDSLSEKSFHLLDFRYLLEIFKSAQGDIEHLAKSLAKLDARMQQWRLYTRFCEKKKKDVARSLRGTMDPSTGQAIQIPVYLSGEETVYHDLTALLFFHIYLETRALTRLENICIAKEFQKEFEQEEQFKNTALALETFTL